MAEGVVWIPRRSPGLAVSEHLAAAAGEVVSIGPPQELMLAGSGSAAATGAETGTTELGEVTT